MLACRRAPPDDTTWVRDLVPQMQAPSFGRDEAIGFFGTAGATIEGGVIFPSTCSCANFCDVARSTERHLDCATTKLRPAEQPVR